MAAWVQNAAANSSAAEEWEPHSLSTPKKFVSLLRCFSTLMCPGHCLAPLWKSLGTTENVAVLHWTFTDLHRLEKAERTSVCTSV